MNDYIKRDKAIKALGEEPIAWEAGEYESGLIRQWESDVDAIKELPPEDVQPVVRCKKCEHWDEMYGTCYCDDFEVHSQDYYIGDMYTEPDFFCGFGKRKGVDND